MSGVRSMVWRMWPMLLLCALSLLPGVPAPMDILYPYGPSAQDVQISRLDDGPFYRVLDTPIVVFNQLQEDISMNTNGLISFGGYFNPHRPDPDADLDRVDGVLAPFWIDWSFVANTGAFQSFRQVTSGPELERATDDVRDGLAMNPALNDSFDATIVIVMTYANATHWGGNEETGRNTVQVVVASNGAKTYAMYQYGAIEWSSVGLYALVGYGLPSIGFIFEHVNSSIAAIAGVESTSNVNVDGRLLMQIDGSYMYMPTCVYGVPMEGRTCLCYDGYTGELCEVELDECLLNTCNGRGECENFIDAFVCDCDDHFTGARCENKVNFCLNHACSNGSCTDTETAYECDCFPGYTGVHCDTEIDECLSCPCAFGSCRDHVARYTCDCDPGFTGRQCDIDIDLCVGNPCANRGHCQDQEAAFACFCPPGFTGVDCEVDLDSCVNYTDCQHGRCVDAGARPVCECDRGYSGELCDQEVDGCLSSPCLHGTCFKGVAQFTCTCQEGYTGMFCEADIQDCELSPCSPHGFCVDVIPGYECLCHSGFTGLRCDGKVDECLSDPCNNGMCQDADNSYRCRCYPGYTGRHCHTEIQECRPYSCLHGSCVDRVDSFSCVCEAGYTGEFCDEDVDDCASGPCSHGLCVDGLAGYSCVCFPGYTDGVCDTRVDACSPSPCLQSGRCINVTAGFVCDCPDGLTGAVCDVDRRPPAGQWADWGLWPECSKTCDNGLQTRYRQCLRGPCTESNNQVQMCNKFPCPGDHTENKGILLEIVKSEYEVAAKEHELKEAIADILNTFCAIHRERCCQIVHVRNPRRDGRFPFTGSDVLVDNGYHMTTEKYRLSFKVSVRVPVANMTDSCAEHYIPDPDGIHTRAVHLPQGLLEEALPDNLERLDQVLCCWEVAPVPPESNTINILLGTLVPGGVILLLLLVACACCPLKPHRYWQGQGHAEAEVSAKRPPWPAGLFYSRYPLKGPGYADNNYPAQSRY